MGRLRVFGSFIDSDDGSSDPRLQFAFGFDFGK
jgi:hypothetical protein